MTTLDNVEEVRAQGTLAADFIGLPLALRSHSVVLRNRLELALHSVLPPFHQRHFLLLIRVKLQGSRVVVVAGVAKAVATAVLIVLLLVGALEALRPFPGNLQFRQGQVVRGLLGHVWRIGNAAAGHGASATSLTLKCNEQAKHLLISFSLFALAEKGDIVVGPDIFCELLEHHVDHF